MSWGRKREGGKEEGAEVEERPGERKDKGGEGRRKEGRAKGEEVREARGSEGKRGGSG